MGKEETRISVIEKVFRAGEKKNSKGGKLLAARGELQGRKGTNRRRGESLLSAGGGGSRRERTLLAPRATKIRRKTPRGGKKTPTPLVKEKQS